MQAIMIRCQGLFKCMAACEVLPWPDCRGPSNTTTHPTPFETAKPPKPRFRPELSRVGRLWSRRGGPGGLGPLQHGSGKNQPPQNERLGLGY